MEKSVIETIVKEKIPCSFISPHLDDAVLSCGGLLTYLSLKTKVRVVTVFTQASSDPCTLSAKAYLGQCGFKDARRIFEERKKEDRKALGKLGIEAIHLDFKDALWRKKDNMGWFRQRIARSVPEFGHVYPTYRFHVISGRVSGWDAELLENIKKELISLFLSQKRSVVFCPLGLGNHVDHVIVRDIAFGIFDRVILWSDFPYNLESKEKKSSFVEKNNFKTFLWKSFLHKKIKLIYSYGTQAKAMFPEGVPVIPEEYHAKIFNLYV